MWRGRARKFLFNIILFLLGVMTCLVCLQFQITTRPSSASDSSGAFYTLAQPDPPCTRRHAKAKDSPPPPPESNYYEEVFSEQIQIEGPNSVNGNIGRTQGRTGRASGDNNSQAEAPTVWVVTPTFYRPEQKPELTRLAQALLPVNHFVHWIIVDDVGQGSPGSLADLKVFLEHFPLTFTLLKSSPPSSRTKIVGKPRGVGGRRAAISWLRRNSREGVVYFADDDNTYDSEIFRQMQYTKKVSMWPVGLVTDFGVSSPIVKDGRVVGFYDGWNGLRKFPVDMAGFAINMELFLSKPRANMPWVAGYEEDELLRSLEIRIQDIQPLATNCTQILVWHTKGARNAWPKRPKTLKPQIEANTNLNVLLKQLAQRSLAGPASSTKSVHPDEKFSLLKFFFGGA